jgi:hypothetical protein
MVGAFLQLLASQSNDHLLPDHSLFSDILSVLFEIDGDESGNDQHSIISVCPSAKANFTPLCGKFVNFLVLVE